MAEPTLGEAYWSLANLKTYRFMPEDRAIEGPAFGQEIALLLQEGTHIGRDGGWTGHRGAQEHCQKDRDQGKARHRREAL